MLVGVAHPVGDLAHALDAVDQLGALLGVALDLLVLAVVQRVGLLEDAVGQHHLADVVQHGGDAQVGEVRAAPAQLLRDAGGIARDDRRVLDRGGHARVDRARQRRGPGQLAAPGGEVGRVAVLVRVQLAVGVALKLVVVDAVVGERRPCRSTPRPAPTAACARGSRCCSAPLSPAPGARIANSSPPSRPTESIGRTARSQALDDPAQQLVAGGMAVHVVDGLEVVEVEQHQRKLAGPSAARRPARPSPAPRTRAGSGSR